MDMQELTLAGVDVQELMDRFLNNAALVKMIVGKFIQDKTYAQLLEAVAQQDLKAAEFACHSLKGVCGNLSLKNLFAMLQEQLRLFRGGQGAQALEMMPAISQDYENAIAHLKQWLAQQ